MRKLKAVTRTRSAFVAALTTACVFSTASYAQSDMDQVKAAADAFHAAISTLDTAKVEARWAQDDSVMDFEPFDKAVAVGWDAVKKTIGTQFAGFEELKVTQAEGPHIQVKGDIAWSTGIASSAVKPKSGAAFNALIIESDVYAKRGGAWMLVSHVATLLPTPK